MVNNNSKALEAVQKLYHAILSLLRPPTPHFHAIFLSLPIKNKIEKAILTPAANPPLQVRDIAFVQPLT